jgi:hypothetical protein
LPDVTSLASASQIVSSISSLTDVPTYESERSNNFNKACAGESIDVDTAQFDYSSVKWGRLPGFNVPLKSTERLSSMIWKLGVPTQHANTEKIWWLCSQCHAANAKGRHHYNCSDGTSNAVKHIRDVHKLTWNEEKEIIPCIRGDTPATGDLDSAVPREQEIPNALALAFDEKQFKKLLIRWIVYDNVSFRQLDSEVFRAFITYISLRAGEALPCGVTVREWIMKGYLLHKAVVKQELKNSVSKVHISFDLWTSGNCLSLNGIVAHFINAKFEPRAILLATPEQSGSHSGIEIADEVIRVIVDFGIEDKLGYFVLDNASNNDTAMQAIADKFDFDPTQRRLRCAGHTINLIARHLLFGFDKNLFEMEE